MRIRRFLLLLLDIVELYIPMMVFVIMFLVFLINIFFRYIINSPLTWPQEVITLSFVWLTILAAVYVRRTGNHVRFTLIYDICSPRIQYWMRITANVIVAFSFIIVVPATIDWVSFMGFKATMHLKIPYNIGFIPIIPFFILVAAHSIADIVKDVTHYKDI